MTANRRGGKGEAGCCHCKARRWRQRGANRSRGRRCTSVIALCERLVFWFYSSLADANLHYRLQGAKHKELHKAEAEARVPHVAALVLELPPLAVPAAASSRRHSCLCPPFFQCSTWHSREQ